MSVATASESEPPVPPDPSEPLPPDWLPGPPEWVGWEVLNGKRYIDAGESLHPAREANFSSIVNGSGDLIYMFHSSRLGTVMGRFSADRKWELWAPDFVDDDPSSWSSAANVVPAAVDHAAGLYATQSRIVLNKLPGTTDGLLGITSSQVRGGVTVFDVHPFSSNFVFDDDRFVFGEDRFLQWKDGILYDPLLNTSLIHSFRPANCDFAFCPESKTGILVGLMGNDHNIGWLTATRYYYDRAHSSEITSIWRRWHRPDPPERERWYENNVWPSFTIPAARRQVFILNPYDDLPDDHPRAVHYNPRITYLPDGDLGTEEYLVTFDADGPPDSGPSLKACRYTGNTDGTDPKWTWWDGTDWRKYGDYNYAGIATATKAREQLYLNDGRKRQVVILLNNDGLLMEVTYYPDDEPAKFSTNPLFHIRPPDWDGRDDLFAATSYFCMALAPPIPPYPPQLWLAYLSWDGHIYLHRRLGEGDWGSGKEVGSVDPDSEILGLKRFPVGINFVARSDDPAVEPEPVVFVVEDRSSPKDELRLFAVAEHAFDETWREMRPFPPTRALTEDALVYEYSVVNDIVVGLNCGGGEAAASMAVDADGYVYAPKYGVNGVIIHPPGEHGCAGNKAWGFTKKDCFDRPGGAAVDNVGEKVYVTDGLSNWTGLGRKGVVQIWDRESRGISCDVCGAASECSPEMLDYFYSPNLDYFYFPNDVAVNEDQGLLYVTNSLQNKVDVFDVETLAPPPGFAWSSLIAALSEGVGDTDAVDELVSALIANGFLEVSSGEAEYVWAGEGTELVDTVDFLWEQEAFRAMGENGQNAFLANLHKQYQATNGLPVYRGSFGSTGQEAGQFMFPTGIDVDAEGNAWVVDCENHRVQKWQIDYVRGSGEPQFEATYDGSIPPVRGAGRDEGAFVYPQSVAVDDVHNRVYVTDPLNGRVQIFRKDGSFWRSWGKWDAAGLAVSGDISGIAEDGLGNVVLGVGKSVVRFRAEQLTVTEPTPCQVIFEGPIEVRGTVSDEWAGLHLTVTIGEGGGDLCKEPAECTTEDPFKCSCYLDLDGVDPGTGGEVRVTGYDEDGHEMSFVVLVRLGGSSAVEPNDDDDDVDDDCDNCPGYPNPGQEDCDHDGTGDRCVIADCDGTPSCKDCNTNDVPDGCDIASGTSQDCNSNGIPDECDIADGTSQDANSNGIPDECEQPDPKDCNGNGCPDEWEVPDNCEPGQPLPYDRCPGVICSEDCQPDGIPDGCQLELEVVSELLLWPGPPHDVMPQVATDGAGLWVVSYASRLGSPGADFDIRVTSSSNYGQTWTPPEVLVGGPDDDLAVSLAAGQAGTWVAAWNSYQESGARVVQGSIGHGNCYMGSGGSKACGLYWEPPIEVSGSSGKSPSRTDGGWNERPYVATDRAGAWLIVWASYGYGTLGNDADIMVAHSEYDEQHGIWTWSDPQPLNNNAPNDSGDDRNPMVVADGAGKWVAVWDSTDDLGGTIGDDEDILVAYSYDNGVTWTDPEPLHRFFKYDTRNDVNPWVATDGAGNWAVAWSSWDTGAEPPYEEEGEEEGEGEVRDAGLPGLGDDADILVSRSSDGGLRWTRPQPLNQNAAMDAGWDSYPQVVSDGAGHWVAVWQSTDDLQGSIGSDWDILVSDSGDAGVSWTDPEPFNRNADRDSGDDVGIHCATDGSLFMGAWQSPGGLEPEPTVPDASYVALAQRVTNDCDGNLEPDECQPSHAYDCNGNGVSDLCDIPFGYGKDCNTNGIPDECEIPTLCNSGTYDTPGFPEVCEQDCQPDGAAGHGIPDECDIASGTSQDCNSNGIPDECEPGGLVDCNSNGMSNLCEIALCEGALVCADCNTNAIPDWCDILVEHGGLCDEQTAGTPGFPAVCKEDMDPQDGVPDECLAACCLPNSDCVDDQTTDECTDQGGHFIGSGTECADFFYDCYGACCFPYSDCADEYLAQNCEDAGGNWLGPTTDCASCPGCAATGVRSCRYHGTAGRLCLDMGVSGGIEPRLAAAPGQPAGSSGLMELDITLDDAIVFGGSVRVDCGACGSPSGTPSSSVEGNTVRLHFAVALPDRCCCTVTLDCGAEVCVCGLQGDIDRGGVVTPGDASEIKPHIGETPSEGAGNVEFDYDVSGLITPGDYSQVRTKFGNTVRGACCFAGGVCGDLTRCACEASGGDYQGDGTVCDPNLCSEAGRAGMRPNGQVGLAPQGR